ncbi:oxysterol-binding protein-related protein 9-like isoform X2 [Corticium candelabrum]|uniref:oxysterol-binding protein-related protein 9-like isoform X2 n=1 Tax=Corticium candelabrum TaxID=121492 RepID=UPI002E266394|nr:oxysterol-binding protein-related protein 9-like isoform X2 [Corticium candelabrum]
MSTSRGLEGPLSKWTNVVQGWQYRWFVLDKESGLLSYYTSKEKMMKGSRRGCLRLRGAVIGIDDEDDSTFTISCDNKTFHFQARDKEERDSWVAALEDTIDYHAQPVKRLTREDKTPGLVSQQEIDQSLREATGYHKLLIDQVQKLEARFESFTAQLGRQSQVVTEISQGMVDAMKECLDLMHRARLRDGQAVLGTESDDVLTHLHKFGLQNKQDAHQPSNVRESRKVNATIKKTEIKQDESNAHEGTKQETEKSTTSRVNLDSVSPLVTLPVYQEGEPFASYSSDEDPEFFDANEILDDEEKPNDLTVASKPVHVRVRTASQEILADSDSDSDDASGADRSVISHLLSQVRIGMDLTRITLPTFILEKRSLLEMYADFFAHPDIFVHVTDLPDPKDRMIQVVKWYLSAFHAGRRGVVAKKPYNPILGEIFQCYWDLSDISSLDSPCSQLVDSGPVPWAASNSVTFIAEQVSHHPPISAFYAEDASRRIEVNAHVYTKSKFLGLAIGVHNIGEGNVSFLDRDEHYQVTFPNGYGRSILTVPWMELGGKVLITCHKTGYSAPIEFHCKPFYGGKKHRITGEIIHSSSRKPEAKIEGEWNGVMYIKHEDRESEVFIDTTTLPVVKKRVRSLDVQADNESRVLWRDVTMNLKSKSLDAATAAKRKLEEKQRAEAKARKETNTEWKQRLFHLEGNSWRYNTPLSSRLT